MPPCRHGCVAVATTERAPLLVERDVVDPDVEDGRGGGDVELQRHQRGGVQRRALQAAALLGKLAEVVGEAPPGAGDGDRRADRVVAGVRTALDRADAAGGARPLVIDVYAHRPYRRVAD